MSKHADGITALAEAVADGTPVDWASPHAWAADPAERRQIDLLKVVEQIGAVHRDAAGSNTTSDSGTAGLHAPATVDVPEQWGPLRVEERIGAGTFGEVYRAWDTRLDREVALKLLRGAEIGERAGVEPAIDEGRMLARVRHPGVVTVYGAERVGGRVGIWMELVHGETLEEELGARGPLPPEGVGQAGVAIAEALSAVHGAGLLHRDVKLQNVMRDPSGRLVLMDFGTGGDLLGPARLTGTPLYLAPEVLACSPATVQSDLYSLGVALFRLATGAYPVTGASLREIRRAHERSSRCGVADLRPDFPAPLARVIEQLLEPDPTARPATATAAAALLRGALTQPSAPRMRRAQALAAASVLASLTGLAVWSVSGRTSTWFDTATAVAAARPMGTASRRARELTSQAEELMRSVGTPASDASEALLRQALAVDPEFAYARILQAWSLRALGRRADAIDAAERARTALARATEDERQFVEASYLHLRADGEANVPARGRALDAAARLYERLLEAQPAHEWAAGNLLDIYRERGSSEGALSFLARAAELQPSNFTLLAQAAIESLRHARLAEAADYARRARQQLDASDGPLLASYAAWVRLFPAHLAWLQDDVRAALAATNLAVAEIERLPRPEQLQLMRQLVTMYVSLGQFTPALALARRIPDARQAAEAEATVLAEGGDRRGLEQLIRAQFSDPQRAQAITSYVIEAGPRDLARTMVSGLQANVRDPLRADWAAGLLAAAEHDHARTVRLLEPVVRDHPFPASSVALKASVALADAWQAQGQTDRAVAVLERASTYRGAVPVLWSSGYAWIGMRRRLARLYREVGRDDEAAAIEREIGRLLEVAEPTPAGVARDR